MSTTAPSKPGSSGYEVSRPHGRCGVCGDPIAVGEQFIAALRETPGGFERVDCSIRCWPQFDRAGILGFWKTVMPAAEQKRKLFVDDEVLCGLFERLADTPEPAKQNFRFVLGLILMRKRMIVYERTRIEGQREIWSVRFRGREELLDLFNPNLDEGQVQEVSQQLGEILNEEL